jgi:thiosulfate/3-mercaptopyruvate sulfurtransferase
MHVTHKHCLALARVAVAVALSAGSSPTMAQTTAARAVEPVTSMNWLKQHLGEPGVVVIATDDTPPFERGHIPTARFVGHDATIDHNGHKLIAPSGLATVLARAGASDQATRIVLYGEPLAVGWLYHAFAALGHADRVSILDGNYTAWLAAGFPSSTETPSAASGRLTSKPASDVAVDRAWVRAHLDDKTTKLLDVRSSQEWERGMMPNATRFLWGDLYSDVAARRLKSRQEMAAVFKRAGVAPGQTVVTYCAVGMRASLAYFAARAAGIPARVYVGSWEDWTSDPSSPIVKDPLKR